MIIEGYLHQSNTKSVLSRITDPIAYEVVPISFEFCQ